MECTCHLVLSCYDIKSIYGTVVVQIGKYTHMHHPKTFALSSIHHIDMTATTVFGLPYSVNPTIFRLIESAHAGFLNFLTSQIKFFDDIVLAFYEDIPDTAHANILLVDL